MATHNSDYNIFILEDGEIEFAIPVGAPPNADVLGNNLNNVLTGDGSDNRLEGGAGNDTLIGGLGADVLVGGSGFDTVSYKYSTVGLRIDLNVHIPELPLLASPDSDSYESIEGVIGSDHNDTIVGTDAIGELLQGGDGSDNIDGGGGNDTIIGGAGNDIMLGGAGIDALSYANATTSVSVEMGSATGETREYWGQGHNGDAEGDTNIGFENLIGSRFDDTLNGNYGHNSIDGGEGNDTITGNVGNDTLNGGGGADIMQGQEDNDTYIVDNAMDEVRERAGEGYDTVITYVSFDLEARGDGAVEVLQAADGTAAINLYGNSFSNFANHLIGNAGNNVLDGRKGADRMEGGDGNDTYYVDNAGDVVFEANSFGGVDQVYTSVSHTLSANVENLTGQGSGHISLTGNDLSNVIIGNGGNNVIVGGGGADVMMGGGGNDTYYIDDINDRIIDTSGTDTVIVSNPKVLAALASTMENITAASGKTAMNLTGNAKNNTLKGNSGNNKLSGMDGTDKLYGGAGKDTFIFKGKATKSNKDTVYDYKTKDDSIWIDNKYMSKLGKGSENKPGKLKKDFFTVGDKAKDGNDYLIYNKKTGSLYYDKDGSGAAKAVEIMKFTNKPDLKYTEFFII